MQNPVPLFSLGALVFELFKSFSVLASLLLISANQSYGQLSECYTRTQSGSQTLAGYYTAGLPPISSGTPTVTFPIVSFPGSWQSLPTASFPDGIGPATLIEATLRVNISCNVVGGGENLTGWTPTPVTPLRELIFNAQTSQANYDLFDTYAQSAPLSSVQLTAYDGLNDFGGTSGFTRSGSLSGVFEQTVPAVSFYPWGYGPATLTFSADCFMSFLGGGILGIPANFWQSNATYNWEFTYLYSTANSQAADCNADGISDSCDRLVNNIPQTIVPGIPDNCQTDCDADGAYDSLQIIANPTLDSSAEFGNDGKLDRCQGRVQWQEPAFPTKGIVGASINTYWVSGSDSSPVFHSMPPDPMSSIRLSGAEGKFVVPREFYSYPQQQGEIMRGIKASVTYAEDTGLPSLNMRTITNYPGWDPLDPLRSGRFDRRIVFPAPVVFQPGVLGKVNGSGSSVSALRDFLSLDSAGASPDQHTKRGNPILGRRPIPSFLLYAMPSGGPGVSASWASDGVSWGYVNAPLNLTDTVVYNNVGRLGDYINDRVKPTLDAITEGGNSALVPLNIAAHSYGGLISRGLLALRQSYPILNRYVSFDGAHGGSEVNSALFASNFFRERSINGTSQTDLTPPTVRGWNYSNFLATSTDHLFFSDTGCSPISFKCDIIKPDSSALGVGRTKGQSRYDSGPNGHCARFAGGWEMIVSEANHSLQDLTREIVTAARFFAEGGQPYIGTTLDPAARTSTADFSADPMSSRYAIYGCGVPPPTDSTPFGELAVRLILAAGPVNRVFQVDSFGPIHFDFDVSNGGATLDVTNNTGSTVYPKLNRVVTPHSNGWYSESFDIDVQGTGVRKLRLSSGTAAEAIGKITFLNKRFLTGTTDAQSYPLNSTVVVSSKMRGASGGVIAPNSGTINATITAPNGTQTALQLFDDGLHGDGNPNNGTYANYFAGATQPGFYQVSYESDYTWAGWPIMRSTESSFEVRSNAATLSPTVTQQAVLNPQSGKVVEWRLGFTVNASLAGSYRLIGELTGLGVATTPLDVVFSAAAPGPQSLSLPVPLAQLYLLPRTGLTLSNIRLVDPVRGQLLAELAPVVVNLPAVSALDLLPAPIVSQVIPSYGPAVLPSGEPSTVILKGVNFETTFQVRVGSYKVKYQLIAPDTIQVSMPTNFRATRNRPSAVDIEVSTLGGLTNVVKGFTFVG